MKGTYEWYHAELSNKLGWNDMLAHVAIPAIDCILSNFIGNIAEVTGDVLDVNMCAKVLIDKWESDNIFALLIEDTASFYGSKEEAEFISLRGEIEGYMRRGMSHDDAIAEWWK